MTSASLAAVLPAVIVTTGLSAAMLALNPFLFLVLLCVLPVLLGLGKLLGRSVRRSYRAWQRSFDAFSAQTQLVLRALNLIKASGAEQMQRRDRGREIRALSEAGRRMVWRVDAYALVQGSVAASAGVVVLVVGGSAVAKGRMTLGELLSFYALVALLLRQVMVVLAELPRVLGGYESIVRLDELLASDESEPYSGTRTIAFGGDLTIDDVSFGFGGEPLLRGLHLQIERGKLVSIVGPNGAGKSTLLSLMLGLYRPQSGRLLADGVPYDELDMPALRRSIGVLLQEPVVFPATVRENIAFGRPGATLEEVRMAARWATADEFIERLPDGYDTMAGDEGALLSGGQRQRIALARALIARPSIILLDEPTTHLDDAAIAHLLENLREFPESPAVVTITHDVDVAARGDSIYRLRDGCIVDAADDLGPPLLGAR
jgi:ABC-type bacteriocin/lantibiotic exporter with double-glycine peptidase domain